MKNKLFLALLFSCLFLQVKSQEAEIRDLVSHHYVKNEGIKIHYVSLGEGPMILFVHGFPDFWYTWREQMKILSKEYRVVAMDLRGYNLSDSPKGVQNYTYDILMKDIATVIQDMDEKSAYLVAHDWGAAIAWRLAAHHPELVEKLIILNISHPKAGDKKNNIPVEERKPSYADHFVSQAFKDNLTENWFSSWVKDPHAKEIYKEAFRKSNKEAMINYYRANFPILENLKDPDFLRRMRKPFPKIKMPVLIIHGEKDPYAITKAHNNTWDYVDNELTIRILPEAGHFTQQDESERVSALIAQFLSEK